MNAEHLLIQVPEDPYKPLLDPERVLADVNKHFLPWTRLLRDITNYGSRLIPRAFSSSKKTLADAVVLGILLRQTVAMLDGIDLLLSNGAVNVASLQLRALFEASVYIDWILAADSETKAEYYYVHNLHRKQLWARRTQRGSAESNQFRAIMDRAGLPVNDKMEEAGKTLLAEIDRVLSQPRFATISQRFQQWRKENGRKPSWYTPLGVSNLRDIAQKVGKEGLYFILYSPASEVVHSSNYEHHIRIGKAKLTFEPIRYLKDFGNVFRFATTIEIGVFISILREYRSGELSAFGRKYQEKWQKDFLNIPEIKFEVQTINI